MKKLIAIAALFAATTLGAQEHSFTHQHKRDFENMVLPIARALHLVESTKHPKPKVQKMESNVEWGEVATFAGNIIPFGIPILVEYFDLLNERKTLYDHHFSSRAWCDFKWSEDGRTLTIVSSDWAGIFFDRVEDGRTLKDSQYSVFQIRGIAARPSGSAQSSSFGRRDFPAFYRQSWDITEYNPWLHFTGIPGHNGGTIYNWDLQVDYSDFSPIFYGWFQWHHKNHLLALKERWLDIGGGSEPVTTYDSYAPHMAAYPGDRVTLTVRTTRQQINTWARLHGKLEGSIKIGSYINLRRFNSGTWSYRTHTYQLKDTGHSWDDMNDILSDSSYWNGFDEQLDDVRDASDVVFDQELEFLERTTYSPTRNKVTVKLNH